MCKDQRLWYTIDVDHSYNCPNPFALIAVFRLFLASFPPSTKKYFTKLRVIWLFWDADWWTCLKLNLFKSYDKKGKYIFFRTLEPQEVEIVFFSTISGQSSVIYTNIFHKTKVQMVILRCWTLFSEQVWIWIGLVFISYLRYKH